MNNIQAEIICNIYKDKDYTQRSLAKKVGVSLGNINKEIHNLIDAGFINSNGQLEDKSLQFLRTNIPKQAIILAAGCGRRMLPINMDKPKGLLMVNGEKIIERLIHQLQDVGIYKISVVVGYMKEAYEFLIDKYNIELVISPNYAKKDNLHSLLKAKQFIDCTYIVPCDVWFKDNPFSSIEWNSWYMMSNEESNNYDLRVNKQLNIIRTAKKELGNRSVGLAYINHQDSKWLYEKIITMGNLSVYDDAYWEDCLCEGEIYKIPAKLVKKDNVFEINTYEDFCEINEKSLNLKTDIISIIAKSLNTVNSEIRNIRILKNGITNRSFLFENDKKRYVMRIPIEETDMLINRKNEADVYQALKGKKFCDEVVYINENKGYKISKFIDNSRVCNLEDPNDIHACMNLLKKIHNEGIRVNHVFNLFGQIDYYEELWNRKNSIYQDYKQTKEDVLSLKQFIDNNAKPFVLTHMDAIPDNFVIYEKGKEKNVRLIDWEYAGMQDPDLDIAMFCIYALYNREQIDHLINIYYENNVDEITRYKIYAYISVAGLLWSNWCEYKIALGVDFGEYALKQYRFAKVFYRIVREEFLNITQGRNL